MKKYEKNRQKLWMKLYIEAAKRGNSDRIATQYANDGVSSFAIKFEK